MASIPLTVRGEELRLLAERGVYWPRMETLVIADPHWGKGATFRAAGIPVPRGTTGEGLRRLDAMLTHTAARRIVFLGDFLHARDGRAPGTIDALRAWRDRHRMLELVNVRGNHDRHAGDPPGELDARCIDGPVVEGPFVFAHHPTASDEGYVLAGHVHPGVDLFGAGRQRERLPCFWFGAGCGVLPAFGDFTGLGIVAPAASDRIFVVADGAVIQVGGGRFDSGDADRSPGASDRAAPP